MAFLVVLMWVLAVFIGILVGGRAMQGAHLPESREKSGHALCPKCVAQVTGAQVIVKGPTA